MKNINDNKLYLFPDVVFYHIEKCAGTSLEDCFHNYFLDKYSENQIYIPEKNNYKHICMAEKEFFEKHNYKVILGHISFNNKNFVIKNHLSITCVRNPIDRMISHYYHFHYDEYKKPLNAFNENDLKKYVDAEKAILLRISGENCILEAALNNLKEINVILIFEKIKEDINKLNILLNDYFHLNTTLSLSELNKNKNVNNEEIKKDKEILYNSDFLNDEVKIYNFICNMDDNERFKLC